jgi:hypothetical protein
LAFRDAPQVINLRMQKVVYLNKKGIQKGRRRFIFADVKILFYLGFNLGTSKVQSFGDTIYTHCISTIAVKP